VGSSIGRLDQQARLRITRRAVHHEINVALAADRAAQKARPIGNRHRRAVVRNLRGNVRLGLVATALSPHDEPHLGSERLAQGRRCRLAIMSGSDHIASMPVFDLTDDERAALIALLKGTIDRDRFPLSPRIRLLRSILEKLGIRSTLAVPSPPPNPRSRLGAALAKRRR
jgi:hypothetical protein